MAKWGTGMNSWRLFGLLEPYKAMLGVLLGVLTVLSAIGLVVSSNILISQAGFHPGIEAVSLLVVLVRFLGISRAVLRYCERLVSHQVTFQALSKLRQLLFARLEPLSGVQILGLRGGDTQTRFQTDVETLQLAWLRGTAPVIVAALVSSLTVLAFSSLSSTLAWVAAMAFLCAGGLIPYLAHIKSQTFNQALLTLRSQYAAEVHDHLEGALELHLMNATTLAQERLGKYAKAIEKTQLQLGRISTLANAAANGVAWLSSLTILYLAVPLLPSLSSVLLSALCFGMLSSFEAILPLGAAFATLEQSNQAAKRLNQTIQQKPLVQDNGKSHISSNTLRFVNLGFAYADNVIFDNLNLSLEQGKWTALLGTSGAGKTTLIRLAMHFLEPTQGQVFLGNTNLKEIPLETLRQNMALVSQTGHLFATSIAQNLRIAKPNASDQELWDLLQKTKLQAVVKALPLQLETPLSANATELSGGERQRLLIARALLRDTPILLLDEPTANLDADTQQEIIQNLREITQQKAVLLVTHRLEILNATDTILHL
jgi:ATP-binding cassette, subfamily C, bacterial CydC